MRRLVLACALSAALWSAPAPAQEANPVTEHYRAYTAAVRSGDVATAETEARAALEASSARDRDSDTTAVLALNLAHVLLEQGKRAEALAPARRAAELARVHGPASRVNPLVADLAVGRAELTVSQNRSGDALWQAVQQAVAQGGLDEPVYDAAVDLGNWAADRDEYPLAALAWRAAINASPGDDESATLSRAQALRGLGTVLLLYNIQRGPHTTLLGTVVDEIDRDALAPVVEATRITRPLAQALSPDGSLTPAQVSYAQSLALLHAGHSQLRAILGLGAEPPFDENLLSGLTIAREGAEPRCTFRITTEHPLRYPREAMNRTGVGAVVVRLIFNADGSIVEALPVATTGGESFAEAVRATHWRVERSEDAAEGCVFPAVMLWPITFSMGR